MRKWLKKKLKLKRIKKNRIILSKKNLIEIGSFVGVHGIKGEVKLKSFTEIPENIFSFKEIFVESLENPINLKFIRKFKKVFVNYDNRLDLSSIAATFQDGLLKLTIPLRQEAKSKTIVIQ